MKIAVLIGGIAYEVQKRLLEGIIQYAKERRVTVDVYTCNGDMYRQSEYGAGEFQIYRLPDLERYDGIVFAKDTIQDEKCADELSERITESGIPAVSIENDIPGMSVFSVDNRSAMRELTTHFIEVHKVKDICYLSGPKQNPESASRLAGVLDAVRAHGMELPQEHIYYGNYWVDSGEALVSLLVKERQKMPEAILCANDDMALGVYMELLKRGIEPGRDVLLSGFDHISDAANLTPAITTVEKPQAQMGYEACRNLVEGKDPENRKFRVKYHYRGSCGCKEYRKKGLAEVQLKNAKQRLASVAMAENNKNMASDLNDCDNFADFCECLKHYIAAQDFSFVYLVLCEEVLSEDKTEYDYRIREEYSDKVHIPIAYEKGCLTRYSYFDRKELLPEKCRKKTGRRSLHYCTASLSAELSRISGNVRERASFNNTQFQNWIMNISNALENIRRQGELKRLIHKLNSVWMLDNLTQVYNRAGFFHYAGGILETCRNQRVPIGMLFVDINKLKRVNDNYGHEEGDFYIKTVADCLVRLKKDGQLLMRYGGDEFVILGENRSGVEFVEFMEKLNPELETYAQKSGKDYEMSVSMGFQSVMISEAFRLDQLMEQADREMYKMKKKKGRAEE